MAKISVNGFELIENQLERMGRPMIRKIVEAGAAAAEKVMANETKARKHIRTRDMLESIGMNEYREWLGGGSVDVYPQGSDRKGVRNATKAYVTNYGRGQRPYRKRPKGKLKSRIENLTGDEYITGNDRETEAAVHAAMQAESDRLMEELNG